MDQTNIVDTESLQSGVRRRGTCVDVFLGISVLILFVAVTALGVGGMLVVRELRSEHHHSSPPSTFDHLIASGSPPPAYKMQNFAFLKPLKSELHNNTMHWAPVSFNDETSVGSNFRFDKTKQSLQPVKKGMYFIYIQVNVICTHKCPAGVLKLKVFKGLTCDVELTADVEKSPVSKKCWTVSPLDGEELNTNMIVPEKGLENWFLDLNTSGLGMFLVD